MLSQRSRTLGGVLGLSSKITMPVLPPSVHAFARQNITISTTSTSDNMRPASRHNSMERNLVTHCKYLYKPLDNIKDSVRLLKLHAAPDWQWPIRCSLFHTTFSEAPSYIALSYVWGERAGSQMITVDADQISVTPNLKHALQRLRPKLGEQDLVMWVDAICINQEDIPERNIQTKKMRAIYQHAASVAVFLGLENNRSATAMLLARDLNACASADEVRKLVGDPKQKESIESLVRLFRRQYWWRIWVIQEVSSARKATVYCGDDEISWTDLQRVCDLLKEANDELQSLFYKQPSYIRTLTFGGPRGLQLSRFSPNISAPPLLELLLSHKSKKSTDPKDKVYALIGVSESFDAFGTIDYSQSLREVYTHTARHIITSSQRLDVICVKQHDVDQYDLPSWAPDWTRPPSNSGATVVGLHHHQPPFTASGNTLANVQFLSRGYVLKVSGFVIDTIETVGMPFIQRPRRAPSEVVPVLEAFHDWWNIFVGSHSNSSAAQAVFGRSISCGNWEHSNQQIYVNKLEAIFALSDDLLSDSDVLRLDPPSRSSTGTRFASSTPSLADDDEDDNVYGGEEEQVQLSAILSAGLTMNRRRFFVSQGNLVGLAPAGAEVGDLVCVLLGCRYPVVLRRKGSDHLLVGEAYVDGYMYGEAMRGFSVGVDELDVFVIH
ncbi:heterokaryon incompatibility protein-domain-containing protein [Rhexocercosporidium sp. MPI-PUGE-AT-0058]|nr:heterokaryon incompatibility protein-domain-containing protein [Rhexocercosporidium sp. MPI-PUGE-AT-0058]